MRGGGVILYPTDTIWGLGCDATNPKAVAKIYAIKQREDAKALISLVDSEAKIDFYVPDVPDVAWQLLEVAERPLTIIYDNVRNLAPNLMAEDGSAALRITREEFSRELCLRHEKSGGEHLRQPQRTAGTAPLFGHLSRVARGGGLCLHLAPRRKRQRFGFFHHQAHGFFGSDGDSRMITPQLAFKIDEHVCKSQRLFCLISTYLRPSVCRVGCSASREVD